MENNTADEYLKEEREILALNPDFVEEEVEMSESDEDIIEIFETNLAKMESHWNDIYTDCEGDWDMYLLNQWSADAINRRAGRPQVTIDISRKFVKSVVAETYKNPPSVRLRARKDGAKGKAKYISDIVRYFENACGSIYAYTWAKECAAVAGIGWLKVSYRYDEMQDMPAMIEVDRIEDPLSIMIDPDSTKLDGSDALYGVEIHGKDGDNEKYTYWWTDEEGTKWAIINGKNVVDKGFYAGIGIPLVPVYGEVTRIRNKVKIFGMIRQLADTQRAYNYTMSEGIERMALTPKSPLTAVEGAIPEAYRRDWEDSLTNPKAILTWNNLDENGNATIPEPKRAITTPDVAWVGSMLSGLENVTNQTTGIFPDSYGNKKSAESGSAIRERTNGSDRGQLVYDEHLQIAIKRVGWIILSLLEPVVTPAGVAPIMNEAGDKSSVEIGKPQIKRGPNGEQQMLPPVLPDLKVTGIDIAIDAAPAYATRKDEGVAKITEMMPLLDEGQRNRLAPKVVRDMDFPGSDGYANIMEGKGEKGDEKENPQEQAKKMQEMQMQMQQMQQQLQDKSAENTQLMVELKTQSHTLLQKAELDNQTKVEVEQMKIDSAERLKLIDAQQAEVIHGRDLDAKAMVEINKQSMNSDKLAAAAISDNKKLMADAEKTIDSDIAPLQYIQEDVTM